MVSSLSQKSEEMSKNQITKYNREEDESERFIREEKKQ